MSIALPLALARPSCTAIRASIPITHQWNTMTLAFARQFCSHQSNDLSYSNFRPSIGLQTRFKSLSVQWCRSFSSHPRSSAEVSDAPKTNALPETKKRTVRIGPLPNGNVDGRTIASIFGSGVSYEDGNHVLRILHHRRTSGSLADYGVDKLGSRYKAVTRVMGIKALEWLREAYPIDEARAAQEWAEKEANRISYELWLADPENLGSKHNDPARIWREQQQEQQEAEETEVRRIGLLRTGPSEFELNIQRKRQERLEAMAKKAEEKEQQEKEDELKLASGEWVRTPGGTALMKPGQETYIDIFGKEQVSRRKEEARKYQEKAQTPFQTPEDMLKETTLAQRLYPMTALVLVVCLVSYGFAHYYIPPSPAYRLWSDLSPTTATIAAIVATNVLVCLLWRVMPLWPLMTRYFMHVPGYPRAVQSVLNVFSHVQYEHLFANMSFLALVGVACHDLVGRGVFLGTYISAGAVGTLVSLYWSNLGKGNISAHSVGASAAIWGISALYCLLTDKESLKIPFLKEGEVGFYPKMLFAAFVAMEIWQAAKKRRTTMDHASHFGGMFVGVSVAGYLHATGFHQRRLANLGNDTAQETAGLESDKTLDLGAIVKDDVKQVKEGVKNIVK